MKNLHSPTKICSSNRLPRSFAPRSSHSLSHPDLSFMSKHKARREPDSEWDNLEFHAGFGTFFLRKEEKK